MRLVKFIFLLLVPIVSWANESVVNEIDLGNDIALKAEVAKFDKSKNTTTDCGGGHICLINNKPVWGADGDIPASMLKSLVVSIKGKNIKLDTSGMFNPSAVGLGAGDFHVEHYYGDAGR